MAEAKEGLAVSQLHGKNTLPTAGRDPRHGFRER
jgi:hypothetical protein